MTATMPYTVYLFMFSITFISIKHFVCIYYEYYFQCAAVGCRFTIHSIPYCFLSFSQLSHHIVHFVNALPLLLLCVGEYFMGNDSHSLALPLHTCTCVTTVIQQTMFLFLCFKLCEKKKLFKNNTQCVAIG